MSSLHEIQNIFSRHLFAKKGAEQTPGKLGLDPSKRNQAGLRIYQNNVLSSLSEALAETFPVVKQLVGDEFFKSVAYEYIRCTPTDDPVLASYGSSFPEFLAQFQPARSLTYLSDIARLELNWLEAYHAEDTQPLTPQDFSEVPPDRLGDVCFCLHPTLRLMSSPFPIVDIWQAHQEEGGPQETISLEAGPQHLFVARPQWRVVVMPIIEPAYILMSALENGAPLSLAVEKALKVDEGFDTAQWLGKFLQEGVFSEFHLSEGGHS